MLLIFLRTVSEPSGAVEIKVFWRDGLGVGLLKVLPGKLAFGLQKWQSAHWRFFYLIIKRILIIRDLSKPCLSVSF